MDQIGKYLILIGVIIFVLGVFIYFFGGSLKWVGHLPGDIHIERDNFKFYFPITTLIIINLILFLIVKVWKWMH